MNKLLIIIMFKNYEDKGLTGLANLGNTCYMNCCIQILSHCYEFKDLINDIDESKLNNKIDSLLFIEWKKLMNIMWSSNCVVAPHGFFKSIKEISSKKNSIFNNFNQNDTHEFLIFILDTFHLSLEREVKINIEGHEKNSKDKLAKKCFNMIKENYSKNYSEILQLFNGIQVNRLIDLENYVKSIKPESFFLLNLSIPSSKDKISIYDCFEAYTQNELLNGDNAWYNEDTQQYEDVNTNVKFWSLPEILIIIIKRYNFNGSRNNKLIEVPNSNLDLSKYVIGYDAESYKYNLFGICNHSGNQFFGHYWSYVKNANNKWYSFNDDKVKEIPENKLISPYGYCFFFRKIK